MVGNHQRYGGEARERGTFDGVVTYTAWFIWRERNNRVFENAYSSFLFVASLIRSDTVARAPAFVRVVDDDLGLGVEVKLETHELNEYSKIRLDSARTRTLLS